MWSIFTKKNFKLLCKKDIEINDNFINKIKEIRKIIYNINTIDYEIIKYDISLNKLNELLLSDWVMENLEINNLDYNVCIKWNGNTKNIYNYIYLKTNKIKFDNFIKKLPIFLKICNYIQENSTIGIKLYLILTKHTKYIELNKIISPKHVNSGYTNNITKEICIWREEEFEKVSFHELIHLFNKDHREENINFIQIYNYDQYFEAITDFKAIIFNIIYLSLLTYKKIKFILKYEYKFIYNQAKLINNNLKNINNQNTPAYSYFILKYYIFKYFIENNYDTNILDNLLYKNINYNKLIDCIKNYLLNDFNYINFNSGRMTLFELK
jgi:hypothetical protein